MHKKAIWLAFSFVSLVNVVFSNPSFSSSENTIGPEPERKFPLSPYDKRQGYVCPNGKAFAMRMNGVSGDFISRLSYSFPKLFAYYNVVKKNQLWLMEIKPDHIYADSSKFRKIGFNVKLLVSKSPKSYTEEQLQLILDKYKFQRDLPNVGYNVFETSDEFPFSIGLENSAGNRIQLVLDSSDSPAVKSISAGGKAFRPDISAELISHSVSCPEEGNLQVRSIYILNDKGDNPGETLAYPAMVLVADVFIYESLKVKNQPDVTF